MTSPASPPPRSPDQNLHRLMFDTFRAIPIRMTRRAITLLVLLTSVRALAGPPAIDPVESGSVRHIRSLVKDVPIYSLPFAADQVELTPELEARIAVIAKKAILLDGWVLIESFTDPTTDAAADQKLSLARAERVASRLIAKGVTGKPVVKVGHGSKYARGLPPPADAGDRHVSVTLIDRRVGAAVNAGIRAARAVLDDKEAPAALKSDTAAEEDFMKLTSTGSPAVTATAPPARATITASPARRSKHWNEAGVRALALFAASTPASYNQLVYREPSADGNAPANYDKTGERAKAGMGMGLEFSGPAETWRGTTIGLRYRAFAPFTSETDFNEADAATHKWTDETTGTAMGAWIDVFPLRAELSSRFYAKAGMGLDIDRSQVTVKETYLDERVAGETAGTSVTIESNLTVLSLRWATSLGLRVGSLTAQVGATLQYPLAEFGESLVAPGDALAWQELLAHESGPGTELAAGVGWAF